MRRCEVEALRVRPAARRHSTRSVSSNSSPDWVLTAICKPDSDLSIRDLRVGERVHAATGRGTVVEADPRRENLHAHTSLQQAPGGADFMHDSQGHDPAAWPEAYRPRPSVPTRRLRVPPKRTPSTDRFRTRPGC
ncbi:MAG: hypothetical protein ACRDLL_02260 [Solirubrobacterales bacterium]